METPAEQLDEASLAKRLEAQKEFVARLISEGPNLAMAGAAAMCARLNLP